MKRLLLALATSSCLAAAGLAAQTSRTVWDGVYSEEQAARGEKVYTERCSKCHGDTLGGQEAAPSLTGATFYSNWEGETLEALADRIRTTMPQDKPGSLTRAQNADLLAYMLRVGGYPAGSTALEGQAGAMTAMTIRMYKP